jgi:hypothetical protein
MSALGHWRTSGREIGMSGLCPKADMCSGETDVRYVPFADLGMINPRHCLPFQP